MAQYREGYAELDDSETVSAFRSHIGYMASSAREGRKAGSEGEKETAAYIYDKLTEYGVNVLSAKTGDEFGIARENGDTVYSRNIVGIVPGYDSKLYENCIVVGARMDNLGTNLMTIDGVPTEQVYYGANGNASGVAMLLELARMVSTSSMLFRRSVVFVAFGASCEGYAGAWYFLNRSFSGAGKIDAMINLDMVGGSGDFLAYTSSNADLNRIIEAMKEDLQPVNPTITAAEPYPSDHRAFYSKAIPSVFFTTGQYPEHDTPRDNMEIIQWDGMERELEYVFNFTSRLASQQDAPAFAPETVEKKKPVDERAYSFVDCDQKPTFLGHSDPRYFIEKWVYQYLKYPEEAVEKGIQGRVNVQFYIDKDGQVKDAKVVKSADPILDREAIRVVEASPNWKPGRIGGQKVRCYVTIPVDFRLEKSSKGSFGIKR